MTRLKIWPAVLLVAVYWTTYWGLGAADISMLSMFLGRLAGLGLLLILFTVWWLTRRTILWSERLLVLGAGVGGAVLFTVLRHPTVLPPAVLFLGLPGLLLAWTVWLAVSRGMSVRVRRAGLLLLPFLVLAPMALVRMEGLRGRGEPVFRWRWSASPEDRYLSERATAAIPAPPASTPRAAAPAIRPGDWPGFRGPDRDGVVHGVKIATDWAASPPRGIWRRRIGPGWSSLAVVGEQLFTQEQRDRAEVVVCIDTATGREVWAHQDAVRFEEGMGGVGPRATPTFAEGKVYALGATGVLNCLAAASGEKVWSRDIAADAGAPLPIWGFSSSPLVRGGLVVVFAGGPGGKGLLAYRDSDGQPAWTASAGENSYSSPQLVALGGVEQVLFVSEAGLSGFDLPSGARLWTHPSSEKRAQPVVQPQQVGASGVLACILPDAGTMLVDVTRGAGGEWRVDPRWTSRGMKPFFNDSVQLDGSLYGFDGSIFCCIDLKSGERRWKAGRYGSGQVLLLADQSLLLVITEEGEAVLVAASPEKHQEVARFQALQGKSWSHPVIAGGRLYLRNSEEMACYELSPPDLK